MLGAMPPTRPTPIDPRGPRFNQAVLTVALAAAFVTRAWPVVPVFAVVLFLGAAFGPRYGPFLRLYRDVIRPRLAPPVELEDPRPPRFASVIGTVFLSAATVAFVAGADVVGWTLALIVAALAGLAATTGICIGCQVWLVAFQREWRRSPSPTDDLLAGADKTWAVFTTPWCASCDTVTAYLADADPSARVVTVDATERPALAGRFHVRTAPTVVLIDGGVVQERLVGAAAVRDYVGHARIGQ